MRGTLPNTDQPRIPDSEYLDTTCRMHGTACRHTFFRPAGEKNVRVITNCRTNTADENKCFDLFRRRQTLFWHWPSSCEKIIELFFLVVFVLNALFGSVFLFLHTW